MLWYTGKFSGEEFKIWSKILENAQSERALRYTGLTAVLQKSKRALTVCSVHAWLPAEGHQCHQAFHSQDPVPLRLEDPAGHGCSRTSPRDPVFGGGTFSQHEPVSSMPTLLTTRSPWALVSSETLGTHSHHSHPPCPPPPPSKSPGRRAQQQQMC